MPISIQAIPAVRWSTAMAICLASIPAILNQSGSVGIGFAIPADTAAKVLQDIVSYGYVVRGWLGMDAFPLTAVIAKRLNLPLSHGLLVRAI